VFIPQTTEFSDIQVHDVKILRVSSIRELLDILDGPYSKSTRDPSSQFVRILQDVRELLSSHKYQFEETEYNRGLQLQINGQRITGDKVVIDAYPTTGTWSIRRSPQELFHKLQEILTPPKTQDIKTISTDNFKTTQNKPKVYTVATMDAQQRVRRAIEAEDGWQRKDIQHTIYAIELINGKSKALIAQYASGKLVVSGRGSAFDRVCEIVSGFLKEDNPVPKPPEEKTNIATASSMRQQGSIDLPYIGTDESGKGDYFGPLVIAGAYVDEESIIKLTDLGVKDSKKLTDRQVSDLTHKVQHILGRNRYKIITIAPDRYNSFYDELSREGKNLNVLLAWGHARALEDLVASTGCMIAVADQFGDERYIQEKLMKEARSKQLILIQKPRAEIEIGVATASILARYTFLQWLDTTSKQYGITLPKGASDAVILAAKSFVATHGRGELKKVAKLHFKTTERI
jgi:ribonuclease HIII